jgi:hypothetical protein
MASQLAFLLFLLIILLLRLLMSRRQRPPALRPIAAFDALPGQTGRAAESGQILHLSLGTGSVGDSDTVASLAGLSALAHLAEQGVATDTPPLITVSSPVLLPLAQNVLRRAYARYGRSADFRWTQVRMVAPTPMAYALGTMDILRYEPVLANVMLGAYGLEVGLIAHAGAEAGLDQIGGSDDLSSLAILYANTDRIALGEELYAIDAYLNRASEKLASLAAEDVARVILILFVIVSVLLRVLEGS